MSRLLTFQLRLSGLVSKHDDKLRVYNRIYKEVFGQSWMDEQVRPVGIGDFPEVKSCPTNEKLSTLRWNFIPTVLDIGLGDGG